MKLHVHYSDLERRRAIVAGGSSGIGLGIAKAFLEQGMKVVVHHRSHRRAAEALARRHPGRAFAVGADLGEEAGAVALVKESARLLGGVDQLVNSAAVWNEGPIGKAAALLARAPAGSPAGASPTGAPTVAAPQPAAQATRTPATLRVPLNRPVQADSLASPSRVPAESAAVVPEVSSRR